jgi:RNA polymerase sigma factor (sigma-70 family)
MWRRPPAESAAAPGIQPGQGAAAQREEASSTLFHAERAQGDPDHPSWTDLLSRTEARVRRMLAPARLPAPYDLDDVVALTLERVYRHLPHLELRSRQSFWGWVRTVAEGALADLGRRALARKRGGKSSVQRLAAADDTTPGLQVPDRRELSASVLMRARELHDGMMQCLAGMRPETAEVLRLRLLEGCSHEEIASRIGRQHAVTVRTIFARGMRRLAACMREKGFDA